MHTQIFFNFSISFRLSIPVQHGLTYLKSLLQESSYRGEEFEALRKAFKASEETESISKEIRDRVEKRDKSE